MLDPSPLPPEDFRKTIFAALVEAQDRARSAHEARQEVLARFGVTWRMVELIEQEGLDKEWPPLGDAG